MAGPQQNPTTRRAHQRRQECCASLTAWWVVSRCLPFCCGASPRRTLQRPVGIDAATVKRRPCKSCMALPFPPSGRVEAWNGGMAVRHGKRSIRYPLPAKLNERTIGVGAMVPPRFWLHISFVLAIAVHSAQAIAAPTINICPGKQPEGSAPSAGGIAGAPLVVDALSHV